jgi:hypothetical protein
MASESGLIRNNTLGIRELAGRKLLPGATERFTFEELKPYMGNKAFRAAFTLGQLTEIPENAPPPPDFLNLQENAPQPGKPAPVLGEVVAVRADDPKALAAFLQNDAPPAVTPGLPEAATLNTPAQ